MKVRNRFIKSIVESAKSEAAELPWARACANAGRALKVDDGQAA